MRILGSVLVAWICFGCGGAVDDSSNRGAGGNGGNVGSSGSANASGAETGTSGPGGATTGTSGSGVGGSDSGITPERKQACDHWFSAQTACALPPLPPSETARLTARFEASCNAAFDQAGAATTVKDVEACAAALKASSCGSPDGPPLECDLRGALPGGARCISNAQCQSGACGGTDPGITPGGPLAGAVTCGACAAVAALGQDCDNAGCPKGAACITADTTASNSVYRCVPIVEGDVGAKCDRVSLICKPGLYCSGQSCAPLGQLGSSCTLGNCVTPLICTGAPATCQAPAEAGGACGPVVGSWECATGSACDANGICRPITWVEPGEACDGLTTLCRLATCPLSRVMGSPVPSTCPIVVADGMPCKDTGNYVFADSGSTTTCDVDSECVNDIDAQPATGGICTPRSTVMCK